MALHDEAIEPQEASAVVAAMIHALLEGIEYRHRQQSGKTGQLVALELLCNEGAHHLCQPLGSFKRDIADETIAHHHVHSPLVDVVAFHVAVKVQMAGNDIYKRK